MEVVPATVTAVEMVVVIVVVVEVLLLDDVTIPVDPGVGVVAVGGVVVPLVAFPPPGVELRTESG